MTNIGKISVIGTVGLFADLISIIGALYSNSNAMIIVCVLLICLFSGTAIILINRELTKELVQHRFERDYSKLTDKQKADNLFFQLELHKAELDQKFNETLEEVKDNAEFAHKIVDAMFCGSHIDYRVAHKYFEKQPSHGTSFWNARVNRFNNFINSLRNLPD